VGTTSAEVAYGGGYAPRTSINGHQWTEAGIAYGGGYAVDALIGSFDQVLDVKSWEPDQDDAEVPHSDNVRVNIEALLSQELDVFYDDGADYLTGTFDDIEAVGDELLLSTSPFTEDWEGISPLDDWSTRFTLGNGSWYVTDFDSSKCLYMINWNNEQMYTADNGPYTEDVSVKTDIHFNSSGTSAVAGPTLRITGSGSACRGYLMKLQVGTNWVRLERITGDGSTTYINHHVGPKWFAINTWYTVMFRAVGTAFYYKVWLRDTESEPVGWTWFGTNSSHTIGDVGIFTDSTSGNENWYFDNFQAESIPPAYVPSGDWESGIIDLTTVDHYSHGRATWIETTPTGTTVAVKCRFPDETAWRTLTNGGALPHIEYENDMRAGSTFNAMELRVEMTTTDDQETPTIEDLRVYFEPCSDEEIELVVDGIPNTVALGNLAWWGRGWIGASGVPPTREADWSDLWYEAFHWWLARDLETITATLNYWGNTIDAITFETEGSKYRLGYLRSYYAIPLTPRYTGPVDIEWTALAEWYPQGKTYEWVLTDKGIAIHADARYIVGHAVQNDHPMSWLAASVNLHDHPLSLLVKGYARNDHPLSLLVQGWRRDDHPLSFLPGVYTINDHPVSVLAAVEYMNDHPMSWLAYGVSREGMIEVNIIDDTTWAELVALGYARED
jgi:hypothetical protein